MSTDYLSALAAYGLWALRESQTDGGGDIDGGAAQDKAIACGLLVRVPVTEPCGESCFCAEYHGGFPCECLRLAPGLEAQS